MLDPCRRFWRKNDGLRLSLTSSSRAVRIPRKWATWASASAMVDEEEFSEGVEMVELKAVDREGDGVEEMEKSATVLPFAGQRNSLALLATLHLPIDPRPPTIAITVFGVGWGGGGRQHTQAPKTGRRRRRGLSSRITASQRSSYFSQRVVSLWVNFTSLFTIRPPRFPGSPAKHQRAFQEKHETGPP